MTSNRPETVGFYDESVVINRLDGTDLQHQVSYEWDIRGQLAKVESPAGTFTYTYDPQNPALLKSLTAPAHKVKYEYEPHRNLITSVKNLNAQNQRVISSFEYENDPLGRRTQITQRGSAFDMLQLHGQNTVQVAYNDRSEVTGYDITKLLDGAKQSGGVLPAAGQPRPDALPKPAPQFAQTYAYDSIGNRTQFLTETGGEKTDVLYESNALNQYTQLKLNEEDQENPTHDPDGNLLDDHRNHYTWNAENRCVKVEAKDGSYTVENAYDYQGRKTTRRHSTSTSCHRSNQKRPLAVESKAATRGPFSSSILAFFPLNLRSFKTIPQTLPWIQNHCEAQRSSEKTPVTS